MMQYISVYDFRDAFLGSDTYKHNFSYDGLTALFNYLEQLEDDIGESIEFDMVAIACDYSEDHVDDIAENYDIDLSDLDLEEAVERVTDYIQENSSLVAVLDDGETIVYQAF